MLDKKLIGNKLKIARLKKNLSQYDLENLADVDQRLITRYENGKCYPKLDAFVKLIKILEIDANEILEQNSGLISPYSNIIEKISILSTKQLNFIEQVVENLSKSGLK